MVYLRTRRQESVGLDEFLSLGLMALAYGVAVLGHTYGFLAVFAAGLALQQLKGQSGIIHGSDAGQPAESRSNVPESHAATHADHASAYRMRAARGFNEQMERIAELAVMLVMGSMLPFTHLPSGAVGLLVLVPLFLVIRPASV